MNISISAYFMTVLCALVCKWSEVKWSAMSTTKRAFLLKRNIYSTFSISEVTLQSARAWSVLNGITQFCLPPKRLIPTRQSYTWIITSTTNCSQLKIEVDLGAEARARLSERDFLEARASRIFLMSEWEFFKVIISKSERAKFAIGVIFVIVSLFLLFLNTFLQK